MAGSTLIINEQHIVLGDAADVPALARDIVSAVHQGGGFVRVDAADGLRIDVLVTAHTRAMIRTVDGVGASPAMDETWPPRIELDF